MRRGHPDTCPGRRHPRGSIRLTVLVVSRTGRNSNRAYGSRLCWLPVWENFPQDSGHLAITTWGIRAKARSVKMGREPNLGGVIWCLSTHV